MFHDWDRKREVVLADAQDGARTAFQLQFVAFVIGGNKTQSRGFVGYRIARACQVSALGSEDRGNFVRVAGLHCRNERVDGGLR